VATIRLEGLDELMDSLEKEWAQATTHGAKAVDRTAGLVERTSKELAPKGDRAHPGPRLADSIHTSGGGTRREVGPSARHGLFMEQGTYKDAPQPFMGPAADRHEGDLVKELERLVGNL
jgi:HK97 gp10 family phage protein